jgi:hypothetical protein
MLLREAFELGGAGAYDRLIAPSVSVRARIEATAGKPIDVVIQRWLASVEQSRPNPMRIRAGATIASLGWCGLSLPLPSHGGDHAFDHWALDNGHPRVLCIRGRASTPAAEDGDDELVRAESSGDVGERRSAGRCHVGSE